MSNNNTALSQATPQPAVAPAPTPQEPPNPQPAPEQNNELPEKRISAASEYISSNWIKPETQASLPQTREDFDNNRDPLIRSAKADMQLTEAQRRRAVAARERAAHTQENARQGQGSGMVKRSRPAPRPKPPMGIGVQVDARAHLNQLGEEQKQSYMRKRRNLLDHRAELTNLQLETETLGQRNNVLNPNSDFNGSAHQGVQKDFYLLKRKAQAVTGKTEKIIRQQKIRKG